MYGSGSKPPTINKSDEKSQFLEQTKAAREDRAFRQQQTSSAVCIQKYVRGFCARRVFIKKVREQLDKIIGFTVGPGDYKPSLRQAIDVYPKAKRLLTFERNTDLTGKRFECLCKYILLSLNSEVIKMSYLSVLLNKDLAVAWIDHIKSLLVKCLTCLTTLKPENPTELRSINTMLTMLVSFTSTAGWRILSGKSGDVLRPAMNQLCNNILNHLKDRQFYPNIEVLLFNGLVKTKPCFKQPTLSAISTLILRVYLVPAPQVSPADNSSHRELLLHVLSIPAFMNHLETMCNDIYNRYISERIFTHSLNYLSHDDRLQAIAVTLEGNRTLCLLGNLIQLGLGEMEGIIDNTSLFTGILTKLLEVCGQFMLGKNKTAKSHWHPVLGWAAQPFNYNEAVPYIMRQIQMLWAPKTIRILYSDMTEYVESKEQLNMASDAKKSGILKKKLGPDKKALKLDSDIIRNTCSTCCMYQTAINVLVHIQAELLSGLAFHASLLHNLWTLLSNLGSSSTSGRIKLFIDAMIAQRSGSLPAGSAGNADIHLNSVNSILTLFCDAAIMLFMILDDMEMYEKQQPFTIEDLISMSDMLNQLVFRLIWQDVLDYKTAEQEPLFTAAHSLLQLLHERDCRRPFTPPNHWLMKDVRPAQFISSIDKGNKVAQFLLQKMPHIIAHKDRVILFRKWVLQEKESLGITDSAHTTPNVTYITVTRQRLLEDGYSQLAGLPVLSLKGLIRVKFVNAQGLDEAGIDQDGVFKEFLEETIKRVFDPSLNLFKVTEEQKLYPSPTSSLTDNHLALFEFVGRILGKAVYESIVVDVPFAPFFLTQVLDNSKNLMYSYFDELSSLDPDLYKNLTYVKHYDGDIEDLELNFSYDEDFMGRLKNYELKPGGRAISVSNDNKISYVHYMARFKMHTQIREQTRAFIQGFRSIVNYDWLRMFSTPEVQKLISGDTVDIDLSDLRKHTQYYGGFHNNHRVVSWLWDILEKDFTEKERGQFLKFVTSCSKPPLLGFAQLDPPFSIRCVEVSDDQDTGDTIGSVLKGFFSIRRHEPAGRLPTSSTCFNLLKLPNYSKKRILKEKLRYSIMSNTGFELS